MCIKLVGGTMDGDGPGVG